MVFPDCSDLELMLREVILKIYARLTDLYPIKKIKNMKNRPYNLWNMFLKHISTLLKNYLIDFFILSKI